MGEEVRNPAQTIPRAIVIALSGVVVLYAVVAVVLLGVLGADGLAGSSAPVADAVAASGGSWAGPVVRVGAAAASLGALLALIAGVGRTTLAMAREGDLPRWLAAVHPRFLVPHRAELTLAGVVSVLVIVTDLRGAIAFSSFGVLLYYAIANIASFTQPPEQRRYPKALQVLGLIGCVGLVVTLPIAGVIAGVVVVIVGVLLRLVVNPGRNRGTRNSVEDMDTEDMAHIDDHHEKNGQGAHDPETEEDTASGGPADPPTESDQK